MTRAQGRLRVYAANVFIGLTLVGCVVAIYIGKTTPKDQYIVALREKKAKAQREEWLAEQEAAKNKKD